MKSKKGKKILLIALTCAAVSTSVSAEAAMKSQITVEKMCIRDRFCIVCEQDGINVSDVKWRLPLV